MNIFYIVSFVYNIIFKTNQKNNIAIGILDASMMCVCFFFEFYNFYIFYELIII